MQPDRRAIVFDLDDTLYPYRRFVTSGFVAVAAHLERTCGLNARLAFAALTSASRGLWRGRELQVCLEQYELPPTLLPDLIDVFRHHEPRLRMPPVAADVLGQFRARGWRVGILTNGQPSIQARKVAALELGPRVDEVVYAAACGNGAGKPDPEPFAVIVDRLAVPVERTVFVGNDERCDVGGAERAGMLTIRCDAWVPNATPTAAGAIANRLADLPAIARALFEEASKRHAA
jgi:putative hydrolase of the HAD superfamily